MGAREASATEGGVGCGGGDGMRRVMRAGRMAWPGGGRRRRRRGRDELDNDGWRGRVRLSDGGEIEDEQNRRSILHQPGLKDI